MYLIKYLYLATFFTIYKKLRGRISDYKIND